KNFNREIKLIKSTQNDFSGIVEDVVKSVVSVTSDNSLGSGFIVNSEGYIVTNYHVISTNEKNIKVITYDKKILSAELIGKNEKKDLALLKIEGSYRAIELAEDEDIQVGKKVIAIGNPLGLSYSVTEGIISAIDRLGPSGLREYIQTDVSLNPGNSGGPLIDIQGKVVGINNFKIGGAESLGFSLKSSSVKETINNVANQTIIP
ncbi:MAG: trypsin-like peptidase domain-containing protein, partial [Nanoarchaeota archaeon]